MYSDSIVRQLECFINNGGTTQELKRILSICGNNEEFLKELLAKNVLHI